MKAPKSITCQKATYLMAKRQSDAINFKETIALKYHLLLCKSCQLYQRQTKKIIALISKMHLNTLPMKLSLHKKALMKTALTSEMNK